MTHLSGTNLDLARDGVCNPVPNVLALPLSLNYTRNPSDGVTNPVRLWDECSQDINKEVAL